MRYQAGQAMEKAAENEGAGGNMAGMGVGLGAGLGMGYGMTGAVGAGMDPNAQNPWGAQWGGGAASFTCIQGESDQAVHGWGIRQ